MPSRDSKCACVFQRCFIALRINNLQLPVNEFSQEKISDIKFFLIRIQLDHANSLKLDFD